jgi:hypothetical protein
MVMGFPAIMASMLVKVSLSSMLMKVSLASTLGTILFQPLDLKTKVVGERLNSSPLGQKQLLP